MQEKIMRIAKASLAIRIEEFIRKNNNTEEIFAFLDEIKDELPETISGDDLEELMEIFNVLSPIWNILMQEKIRNDSKGNHNVLLDKLVEMLDNFENESNMFLNVMKTPKVNELYNDLMKLDYEKAEFIFLNPNDNRTRGKIYSIDKNGDTDIKAEIKKQIKKIYNAPGYLTCYLYKEGITYISMVDHKSNDWHIYSEREIAKALLINGKYPMKLNKNQRLFDLRSGNILK